VSPRSTMRADLALIVPANDGREGHIEELGGLLGGIQSHSFEDCTTKAAKQQVEKSGKRMF
jgi:hypothetical protein